MPKEQGAAQLIQLVAFDERVPIDDGYGNTVSGPFVERFQQRAAFIYMRGNERVDAAAQASQIPLIIRTRNSVQARTINNDWQARDVRTGTAYNIKTITTDNSREFLELLCESGVATG
jgi:head-tail adaptor